MGGSRSSTVRRRSRRAETGRDRPRPVGVDEIHTGVDETQVPLRVVVGRLETARPLGTGRDGPGPAGTGRDARDTRDRPGWVIKGNQYLAKINQ